MKKIAEKRRLDKVNEIFREFESVLARDHPYVKAGQAIINLTPEIQHGFAAEQLLQKSTSFEAMLDIFGRAAYEQ